MRALPFALTVAITAIALVPPGLCGQSFALDSTTGLQTKNATLQAVTYKGRKAVFATPAAGAEVRGSGGTLAIVSGTDFHDGAIEVDVSGKPGAAAGGEARGFVGIAFRMTPDAAKYECFYLRPTNGRAEDQERRNHSVQYISSPDYEWQRLRKETPGKYESYADLVPGEWTRMRIEVKGDKARLYVNGAAQPVLVVNDLKRGDSRGAVALWIGPGTEAHFANLKLSQ